MHICIIGSGITGLAAAHYLSSQSKTAITVLESSSELGGRARVTDGAEHCTRIFLEDYSYTFQILNEIPSSSGSIADALRPVQRFAWVQSGRWVKITHVYAARARELSLREKWAMLRTSRPSLLIAKHSANNSNLFGAGVNYSLRSVFGILRSLHGSHSAFVLPGRTDELLVKPWVQHLERRGVVIRPDSLVERLTVDQDGVNILLGGAVEHYDAVLVTAFVHDAYALLDRSEIPRRLDWRQHLHCRCFTIDLDPREPMLEDDTQRAYTTTGLMVVVQPDEARCIALTTTLPSTAEDFVVGLIRDRLGLVFAPTRVRVRDNLDPADGVFIGEQVEPTSLEDAVVATTSAQVPRRVYFAGSYTASSYAVDSAESACRSALRAVERIAANHPEHSRAWVLPKRGGAGGLPAVGAGTGAMRRLPPKHPNVLRHPRTAAMRWRLACFTGTVRAAFTARISLLDLSGIRWSGSGPVVFLMNTRGGLGAAATLLTFRRLGVHPRLVVADRSFEGFVGRVLDSIGALPAILGSTATRNAVAAAVQAGDSVAFSVGGTDGVDSFEVVSMTGGPIVPIGLFGVPARRVGPKSLPRVRARPRVVVVVGKPIRPDGLSLEELELRIRTSLRDLELLAGHHVGEADLSASVLAA